MLIMLAMQLASTELSLGRDSLQNHNFAQMRGRVLQHFPSQKFTGNIRSVVNIWLYSYKNIIKTIWQTC